MMGRHNQARNKANFQEARKVLENPQSSPRDKETALEQMRRAMNNTVRQLGSICDTDFVDAVKALKEAYVADPRKFFDKLFGTTLAITKLNFQTIQEYMTMVIETSVAL